MQDAGVSVFVFLLHSSLSFPLANGVIVSNFQDA